MRDLTQSVPARVDSANWNGEHVRSTSDMNCRANVFPTRRLEAVPVAMPRTPPSLFWRAVMLACMNARMTSPGRFSLAILWRLNSASPEFPGRPNTRATSRTSTLLVPEHFRKALIGGNLQNDASRTSTLKLKRNL